ncbi:MAG: cyclic peptide export ABC transporter [Methylocystis sp.]|nr:cyclic peptide export ABC transporter [Methylocystis sp.]
MTLASASPMRLSLWSVFSASKAFLLISVVGGLISGVSSAILLTLVNQTIERGSADIATVAGQFFLLCFVSLVSSCISLVFLARIAQDNLYNIRQWVSRCILAAPLRKVQAFGPHRLMAVLTNDVESVVTAQEALPTLFIEGSKALAVFAYLLTLSPPLFAFVVIFIALCVVALQLPQRLAWSLLYEARQTENTMFNHFRAATEGSKELKMDARRRRSFIEDELNGAADKLRSQRLRALNIFVLLDRVVETLFYLLIGIILFLSSYLTSPSPDVLTGFVLAILFLGGPLTLLGGALAPIGKGIVALRNIEEMGLDLAADSDIQTTHGAFFEFSKSNTLELDKVVYKYQRDDEESGYQLGPIDLRVEPGSLLFITGGNGSGKTTLAMLILGLYAPDSGEIRLGGIRVEEANREAYRQQFSAVFADAYVFDALLGYKGDAARARAQELLALFKLDGKLRIDDGRFSTTHLSRGQRKRLALLTAYVEDRPFYVFDEWAAEQDPEFRDVFYHQLLPDLKARGKTVIVITHDDHYFDVADNIIRLNTGRIENTASAPGRTDARIASAVCK